jgi:hypothetical protein
MVWKHVFLMATIQATHRLGQHVSVDLESWDLTQRIDSLELGRELFGSPKTRYHRQHDYTDSFAYNHTCVSVKRLMAWYSYGIFFRLRARRVGALVVVVV